MCPGPVSRRLILFFALAAVAFVGVVSFGASLLALPGGAARVVDFHYPASRLLVYHAPVPITADDARAVLASALAGDGKSTYAFLYEGDLDGSLAAHFEQTDTLMSAIDATKQRPFDGWSHHLHVSASGQHVWREGGW